MAYIFEAPQVLGKWYIAYGIKEKFPLAKLVLPTPEMEVDTPLNKACLQIDHQFYLAGLTLWGEGSIEWLVMDVRLKDFIIMRDLKVENVEEAVSTFNGLISELEGLK